MQLSLSNWDTVRKGNFIIPGISLSNAVRQNRAMDTSQEIRRKNARYLADQEGGSVNFANLVGISESRVSQIIGKNPTKNIGNVTARRIEECFDKPVGWLDIPHVEAPAVEVKVESNLVDPALIAELITLYALSNDLGRNTILDSARVTAKLAARVVASKTTRNGN